MADGSRLAQVLFQLVTDDGPQPRQRGAAPLIDMPNDLKKNAGGDFFGQLRIAQRKHEIADPLAEFDEEAIDFLLASKGQRQVPRVVGRPCYRNDPRLANVLQEIWLTTTIFSKLQESRTGRHAEGVVGEGSTEMQ